MTIQVGETTFPIRTPKDLDADLLAVTGCNAFEIARGISSQPTAGAVATALRPFLPADAPSVAELAASIAQIHDEGEFLASVRKLYADAGNTGTDVQDNGGTE